LAKGGEDKQVIREHIWALLRRRRVARFPFPITDRIPNFVGAERAAARVAELPEWKRAKRIKCNPDAPQRPLRLAALRAGKTVFMAVPRLTQARCFIRLDPAKLGGRLAEASTIGGASRLGEPVLPRELGTIDLVIAGSVAVDARGARVGKGGGYSDLEFALARTLRSVTASTPVLTTVHDLQVIDDPIPMTPHDVPVDLIVTPDRVIRTHPRHAKPRGIHWNDLSEDQLATMPPLEKLRRATRAAFG
jgi:5-formyltetrahydrofolate cyclo-ligase